MANLRKALLIAAVMVLVSFVADRASAQAHCSECDATSTPCSSSCWYCTELVDPEYGVCPQYAYVETTCGGAGAGCMQDNCTPDWQETSRVNQGTYGVGYSWYCEHHRVDNVTEYDNNECSTESWAWSRNVCDDYVDGHKWNFPPWPDCCDGVPNNDFTCNDYHHCY